MPRRIRELSGALAALALSVSCGVSEDEAVQYKDEAARQTIRGADVCTTLGCPDPLHFCVELFFEFGRSPALCVHPRICDQLVCQTEGRECAVFDGFPGQVKCIEPR